MAQPNTKPRQYAIVGVLVLGAALRIWQYLGDPSQYLDELAISRNVQDRDAVTLLTEPLRYDQSAPPGFLLATRAAITLFGISDYALRLFPMTCSLIGLWLFTTLTTRFLTGTSQLIALLLYAICPRLIYNAANVKQYASDVLVCLVLANIACHLMDQPRSRLDTFGAALAGFACTVFSYPAGIVASALWGTLMLRRLTRGEEIRDILWLGIAWIIPAGLVIIWAKGMMSPETMGYMKDYWQTGFPPADGSTANWLVNLVPKMISDYTIILHGRMSGTMSFLGVAFHYLCVIAGVVFLYRWDPFRALVIASPLLLTICLAVTYQYPFSRRAVTFLIPLTIIAISASLRLVEGRRWVTPTVAVLILALPVASIAIVNPPVIHLDHVKPLFEQLRDRREPGDTIWFYYGSSQPVHFYGERYGLSREDYIIGPCRRGEGRREYLRDLDVYRGIDRVWIFISHPTGKLDEETAILSYLHAIGLKKYEIQHVGFSTSSLHLFDLSNSAKLSSVTADIFAIPPLRSKPDPSRHDCNHGPISAWKD